MNEYESFLSLARLLSYRTGRAYIVNLGIVLPQLK